MESSCFVWGFGSNKGMPCKRLNPRFEEKVSLVSFIHAPKDKSVFGLVLVSSEGRICVWEDVANNPVDHFYNLVSPFNPGETPLKIVEFPVIILELWRQYIMIFFLEIWVSYFLQLTGL